MDRLSTIELWDLAVAQLKAMAILHTSKKDRDNLIAASEEVQALIDENQRLHDVLRGKVKVTIHVDVPEEQE